MYTSTYTLIEHTPNLLQATSSTLLHILYHILVYIYAYAYYRHTRMYYTYYGCSYCMCILHCLGKLTYERKFEIINFVIMTVFTNWYPLTHCLKHWS